MRFILTFTAFPDIVRHNKTMRFQVIQMRQFLLDKCYSKIYKKLQKVIDYNFI